MVQIGVALHHQIIQMVFPVLIPTNYIGNVTGGTIPRRLAYPPSEKVTNGANYNAAVSLLDNGDKLTSHMWWDKK